MLISAGIIRLFLGLGMMGMAFLAIFYLRQRRMPFDDFLAWGLLAIFVPVFGPFWVIYKHPGRPSWSQRVSTTRRR
jgi:pilus assembly protein TadC